MSNDFNWILSNMGELSTEPMFEFIRQQEDDLFKATQGKLKAIHIQPGISWNEMIQRLSATMSGLTNGKYHAALHKDATDASTLYTKHTYEFLVIDEAHKYELSLFQVSCNDSFPVLLMIDPTIASESNLDSQMEVESLEEFKEVFISIIQSRKVTYIINRLLHLPAPQEEKKIEGKTEDKKEE